ncbi:MAG: Aspartyl/glutamyl-tRNA(Asn/Gln) amidotransferase subunit B [Candidatus Jorgensenbacteria bacterium GW2011_GWA1_48_11]|uniref:Aspartyl/glutamyl-tRNA(Asn/Gln) amidotransferase subunit B n=1 Tax=Candidatus Jorgensenbacteria bacterium GW2011_GWA1_48_11 TaxID=1618660 RepID=A0A0G1U9Q7_9BACT|nr:MAG: Aspartyl/glutamyl-tRNA(Asn/Gln) amidotransferase subunit B [Candidatus Jorgensenbacteria bacterium GW2011_GWA1_48_11]KKW12405.1 MAG: Aspartyl/glutamyl-tRNA(Asn/Gln) amidotransferase subunit B [Candidatus Jorgensenbacteria bacterium GW2011_GWB1_49_9]
MRIPTIGLEIHAELSTKTKMFCRCLNDFREKHPNQNVCPVCLAHPGNLPVVNIAAVEAVVKAGLALGGEIAKHSHFDRKSYFYPDLPKAYQISQYEEPLVTGGRLDGIRIRRIHLEEDTGRLLHELPDYKKADASFVDYNRAGVPLMELVTEPDIKNAEEAVKFASDLQLIFRYLGISDADMEKGQMRVEANISLDMGTKVEVKNINSFKAVHDAIEYELKRQEKALEEGHKIIQETRGWDDKKGVTLSQRSKESAHDYRYFPEPDLPPLDLKEWDLEKIKAEIPELPEAKTRRFVQEFGLPQEQVWTLVSDKARADYFEEAVSELKALSSKADPQILFNYFLSDLMGIMKEKKADLGDLKIAPEHFAHLVAMIQEGKLSSRLAKDLLLKMFETGEDPETLMNQSGLKLMSDEFELRGVIKGIIEKNPKPVADYKKGKATALQFLIGQAMAGTKGQADPGKLREMFEKELEV